VHADRTVAATCSTCGWSAVRTRGRVDVLDRLIARHVATPGEHDVRVENVVVLRCQACSYRSPWLRTVAQVDLIRAAHLASRKHQERAPLFRAARDTRRQVAEVAS
jgi:hypothetical protein